MQKVLTGIEENLFTEDEYLSLLESTDEPLEFFEGMVFSRYSPLPILKGLTPEEVVEKYLLMAESIPHLRIKNRLLSIFMGFKAAHPQYEVYGDRMIKVYLETLRSFIHPDLTVTEREKERFDERNMLLNPLLCVEVLSESTANRDRGSKFAALRGVEDFQEYLLIDQSKVYVEHHVRQGESRWMLDEYNGEGQAIQLASVPLALSIADVYAEATL